MECNNRIAFALLASLLITSCTFNPYTNDKPTSSNLTGAAIGAGAGGGAAWLLGGSKLMVAGSALAGGALGYYVTTLRFSSGGVIQSGGQVFSLGDYVSINIPTDRLFDTNSSEFLDNAPVILNSAAEVLKRYPQNNIIISGNTSGFGTTKWQLKLSEARARQVAAYLWAQGINSFQGQSTQLRKLIYTGYGNYFPVANNIHNDSIRQNSRIQITAYPTSKQLKMDKCYRIFNNIGGSDEPCMQPEPQMSFGNEFAETLHDAPSSKRRSNVKDDGAWTNYNNFASADQTNDGGTVAKQGGFKGEFSG